MRQPDRARCRFGVIVDEGHTIVGMHDDRQAVSANKVTMTRMSRRLPYDLDEAFDGGSTAGPFAQVDPLQIPHDLIERLSSLPRVWIFAQHGGRCDTQNAASGLTVR